MALTFSVQEALSIARRHYDLDATAAALPSESDANFALEGREGARFVLKITGGKDSSPLVDCQNAALEHLRTKLPGEKIPRIVPTADGAAAARVTREGVDYLVRLVSFVEGVPLARFLPHSPRLLHRLGALVGSLDEALIDFDHEAAHRSFEWRLEDAFDLLVDTLKCVPDSDDRRAVEGAMESFGGRVLPHRAELRSSVIHGDCNDYNLLVQAPSLLEGDGVADVSGIIDFGDMSHSWTVSELAILCAYGLMGKSQPLEALRWLVEGYHGVHPLTVAEQAVLPDLIRMRLAVSLSLAHRNARRDPENAYLRISQRPARTLLRLLSDLDPDLIHAAIARGCTGAVQLRRNRPPEASLFEPDEDAEVQTALRRRRKRLGPSLSLSYNKPLKIVRGRGQFLYDHHGQRYLDCVNNVSHVGHCHPRVVAAADLQMRKLNTNTRYLHDTILDYSERLLETLPSPLSVCYFACSGSEANELALRLARVHTGRRGCLVVDGAYHGNTSTLIDLSPYKFEGRGGAGQADYVFKTGMPDCYRGAFAYSDSRAGPRFAAQISECIAEAERAGGIGAFLCEALLGCGGQIVPPPGYLEEAYRLVREAGGVCIADEVQVGFGRVGARFWGFELQDVVPDIVTMGKPMGNGHPLSAVVTTPEIAASFDNGMEYFNTFGGNPVSCAVGLAVLDVIESEALQQHAGRVGSDLKRGLARLQERFPLIGDVRGEGLFLGFELVRDPVTLEPAPRHATYLVERMRDLGILLSTDGPLHNVIKIKPPLVFDEDDAARVLECLGQVLQDTVLQV